MPQLYGRCDTVKELEGRYRTTHGLLLSRHVQAIFLPNFEHEKNPFDMKMLSLRTIEELMAAGLPSYTLSINRLKR